MTKSKYTLYEINKEDMLECECCGEMFKTPTIFDECPNCSSPEFHRIDYSNSVEILIDASKLPFKSITYKQRINTNKVVDGIYYVLCSKTYSCVNDGEKRYFSMDGKQTIFVPLDEAKIFTNRNSAFQAYAFSSMIRDAHCNIHKVVVIDKHVIEDLGKVK